MVWSSRHRPGILVRPGVGVNMGNGKLEVERSILEVQVGRGLSEVPWSPSCTKDCFCSLECVGCRGGAVGKFLTGNHQATLRCH